MASIKKHEAGGYRVFVKQAGVRRTKVLTTLAEARAWGRTEEAAIGAAERGQYPRKTLSQAIERYVAEVSVKKAGARAEELRLRKLERDFPRLAAKVLSEVGTPDMVAWRDARLKTVTRGTVQRETNTISNLFTIARKEWKWCGLSPITDMGGPGDNPPRDRLPGWREIRRVLRWLGYRTGTLPRTRQENVAWAFLVALRTGLRVKELLALNDERVDMARRVARVPHKMQHQTGRPRQVPFTRKAARLLGRLHGRGGALLDVSAATLDALWRKACAACLVDDLHFHDSRAAALTWLARKVDVMTLARISGHKDVRILVETYYRETAASIAARI